MANNKHLNKTKEAYILNKHNAIIKLLTDYENIHIVLSINTKIILNELTKAQQYQLNSSCTKKSLASVKH